MKNVKLESEFVFIKNGNVFMIDKDKYNWLNHVIVLDVYTVQGFLNSEYKTTVLDEKGEILAQNFKSKSLNLDSIQELLEEIEQSYNQKLDLIDNALAKGDKELFMMVTGELYG